MDTDASVRALAPSSLFGGSRESLPLSVLSTTVEGNSQVGPSQTLASRFGSGANAERASIYSATGVAPALASERNSFYGGSVRSGVMGHGASTSVSGIPGHAREGSISGSFVGSPLAAVASNEEKKENNEKS